MHRLALHWLVLTLCDASDSVVLFKPYYFNHMMALQMTGSAPQVQLGPCNADSLHPDLQWLQQQLQGPKPPKMVVIVNPCNPTVAEMLLLAVDLYQQQLQGPKPPKMVVIVNPCNPTGVLLPKEELEAAAAMCAAAGSWLVLDNTYEDFLYEGRSHHTVSGPNVISVFSFSKAYGMMGWRVGYIAYPGQQLLQQGGLEQHNLGEQLLKVQDTIIVCAPQMSQQLALAALQEGEDQVQQGIAGLSHNRELIADALSPLGTRGHGWVGGEGAIYYWARLPERFGGVAGAAATGASGKDAAAAAAAAAAGGDEAVVEWLIKEYGVCIIPGSACGVPGHVRVAFANLRAEQCEVAAARLKQGLQQLVSMDTLVGV
ncbi:hypothetical protein OEZ86_009823 [Tetradesmus obliquus]|uniref:Aminotransferase class I/classII large domain-containing protein n=1 Tax=Tetradesmus obliquus TaxID=3088 RepID=A0ABY8UMW1_TETOB|nr:hypothetical protein OEZ85_001263 [Tetradesmus obliquus]WIA43327.1 hypothetical protein OEZ86_009823 [Tetradesmus obliquus]